jgi:putative component of toxin-antitoxin plasmid stabilization module
VKSTKESTHAFIIRIWIEPREKKDEKPIWRGVIEHVGSGDRVYFDQLEHIATHVMAYIEAKRVTIHKGKSSRI